jgi:hypothetical protein
MVFSVRIKEDYKIQKIHFYIHLIKLTASLYMTEQLTLIYYSLYPGGFYQCPSALSNSSGMNLTCRSLVDGRVLAGVTTGSLVVSTLSPALATG